jgi:hypothetical protein
MGSTNQTLTTNKKYSGVQVNADPSTCCQAVRDIAGQRFLTMNAPKLPLDGCDAETCLCSFKRYDDRRTEFRRLSDVGFDMASQLHEDENREAPSTGRRKDDDC